MKTGFDKKTHNYEKKSVLQIEEYGFKITIQGLTVYYYLL